MARLHGLGYVLIKSYPGGAKAFLQKNPWIRSEKEDQEDQLKKSNGTHSKSLKEIKKSYGSVLDETDGESLRGKLMSMAASALKSEANGDKSLETLLERQDWLDQLRKVKTQPSFISKVPEEM